MFKHIFATAILITATFTLLTAEIYSIDAYNNEYLYKEFDCYGGTVLRYENRLFVQNEFSIEEYNILGNGELERLHRLETKQNYRAYIDGDRLYSVMPTSFYPGNERVVVYNIATTPFYEIGSFEYHITPGFHNWGDLFFTPYHIMAYDGQRRRYIQFDKLTFQEMGDYYTPNLRRMLIKTDTLMVTIGDYGDQTLYFYELHGDYEPELVSTLSVTYDYPYAAGYAEGILILPDTWFGMHVVDIQDIANPALIYEIPSEYPVQSALYYEGHIVARESMGSIYVYQLGENGEYNTLLRLTDEANNSYRDLFYLDTPYLYVNQTRALKVYDITDFSVVASYGAYYGYHYLIHNKNDLYMFEVTEDNPATNTVSYNIYNVFDDELLCSFDLVDKRMSNVVIEDNILYSMDMNWANNTLSFDIYSIANQQLELINSFPIAEVSYRFGGFTVHNNKVYLNPSSTSPSQYTQVYEIGENELVYIGGFEGSIQSGSISDISDDYLVNIQSNRVLIRDIDDFNNILATYTLPNWGFLYAGYVSDNVFLLSNDTGQTYRAYYFDLAEQTVEQIFQFPQEPRLLATNGVISNSNMGYSTTSTYHGVITGRMHQIGQRDDERYVWWTYFFPERRKMVQHALSGIWIYDIDVTLGEADAVAEVCETALLSNYPNPFNPSTTIAFEMAREGQVCIEVYNIKGQKVRSLVNGLRSAGSHTVVWNGRDDCGVAMSSGVYFYKLTAGGVVSVKKMVMVK